MENKHIELVKKWLADKDSVGQTELRINADDADAAAAAAARVSDAAWAAYEATDAARAAWTADAAAARAAYYVKIYEEMTDE